MGILQVVCIRLKPLICVHFVKGNARLEDVHKGIPLVPDGPFQYLPGLIFVPAEGPGYKGCVQGDGHSQGIEWFGYHPMHLHRGLESCLTGGGCLTLGQTIDHIVMDNAGDIRISADGMHEMVSALSIHIPVTAFSDHRKIRVGCLDGSCRGKCPAVQPV